MMNKLFSEDILIEQPTIALFKSMKWDAACCFNETFVSTLTQPSPNGRGQCEAVGEGADAVCLGRETPAEVVLVSRLRRALEKLNPDLPAEAITKAIEELTRDRSRMSAAMANRDIYRLIKDGVRVKATGKPGRGMGPEEETVTVKIIDWEDAGNNDFFLASQLWIAGDMYKRRADLVGFVNGLPLVFIELKASHKRLEDAYNKNLRDYKDTIPQLFWFNAFIILSNGSNSRIGSLTATWEHFAEWKHLQEPQTLTPSPSPTERGVSDGRGEGADRLNPSTSGRGTKGEGADHQMISLETMIRGTCEPSRLLDLVENFILFSESKGGLVKMVAKNHQYLGVNAAIAALMKYRVARAATLTPALSQGEREQGEGSTNYRGGYEYSGLVDMARELRQRQTSAEEVMWEMLRDRRFMGLKFRRQHQVGDYVTDFHCNEAKLVVELDGPVHERATQKAKDADRDKYLRGLGLMVIRIKNEVVLNDPDSALKSIQSVLPSTSGRGNEGEGATHGRLGVFWHTQGSGKSYSMVFFAQKAMRKLPGNFTFVVVTDRQELDDQIYKNFAQCGVVTEAQAQATSGEHLKQLLKEDHRYVFTLIQKFRTASPSSQPSPSGRGRQGEGHGVYPMLSDRSDIIVMTDEAHRSQYDIMAMNMRNALPNAAFIGFTGTPLMAGEEKTREVFGEYVSIYNFKQSVDDGATVPLYYENRIPELQLTNADFKEDMERLLEEAELDEGQEKKLERDFAREYHLITRDDRLEKIAEDIVQHFMGRGQMGKAMVICIDKATAVKMYDKVRKHWQEYIASLKQELPGLHGAYAEEAKAKIAFMEKTDMAVVVSQSQNEVDDFRKKKLEIAPHRARMLKEDLDEKFKDPKDPFRLVFVCAMWMTGFDVPSCSTIYLDKPMRNHTLMQTIARANRVFPEKISGVIVDYVGIFRDLRKALAIYGTASGGGVKEGDTPVISKAELVKLLKEAVSEAVAFCEKHDVDLNDIMAAKDFAKVKAMDDAVEAIIVNDVAKLEFMALAYRVNRLFKAALPDRAANNFYQIRSLLSVLADKIKSLMPVSDVSSVMYNVGQLLDRSIAAEGYVIAENNAPMDLSQVNFEALKKQFEKGRKRMEAERLRRLLEGKVAIMIRLNRSRMDYGEKLQKMIDEYNAGSINVETFFKKLVEFSQGLHEEDQRAIRENLSEEELAIFDLLTKPDPKLTKKQEAEVKKVAKELLEVLKQEKLVLDWRKRQQTRAAVRVCIEEQLDQLPQPFTPELWQKKCELVYQHVFESYANPRQSIYWTAA